MRRALEQPADRTGAEQTRADTTGAERTGADATGTDAVRRLLTGAAGDGGSAAIGAPGLVELVDWEPAGSEGTGAPGTRPTGEGTPGSPGGADTSEQGPGRRAGDRLRGASTGRSGAAPGLAAARVAARTLRVLPLTAYEVFLAADLVRTYPELPLRAALHVAIMLNNGELELVSDDTVFDQVSEIRRIPPARLARTLARRRAVTTAAAGEAGPGDPLGGARGA